MQRLPDKSETGHFDTHFFRSHNRTEGAETIENENEQSSEKRLGQREIHFL